MSAEQIRSIGCGPVGAVASAIVASLLFRWQVKKWDRWVPMKFGGKGRAELLAEHKTTLRVAKVLSCVGICIGLLCYMSGWLNHYDWRGLGLGVGLMSILLIGYIVAANVMRGPRAMKEILVTFVISERTPPGLLIGVMLLCFVGGLVSAISLLLRP